MVTENKSIIKSMEVSITSFQVSHLGSNTIRVKVKETRKQEVSKKKGMHSGSNLKWLNIMLTLILFCVQQSHAAIYEQSFWFCTKLNACYPGLWRCSGRWIQRYTHTHRCMHAHTYIATRTQAWSDFPMFALVTVLYSRDELKMAALRLQLVL